MSPYNKRRIIGYSLLIIIFLMLLVGCSMFPSKFDSQEHARIVNVHFVSLNDSVCSNREQAAQVSNTMYQDAYWAYVYGSSLPDNGPMSRMSADLMSMTKELRDRYQRSESVSQFYCKSKLENIRRATDTMIKASARRPR